MNYYPIIIFAYNRPELLKNCLISLKENKNINKHKCYFFCDGPKNLSDKHNIENIKKILNQIKINFKQVVFNKTNKGLASNIIKGVSKILKKNKAAIVVEDDLILAKNAIKFINFFLNKKINDKKIGSVSAYSYLHNTKFDFQFDCYYSKRHCSWAWGTWSDRWKQIKWDAEYINNHFKEKKKIKNFENVGLDLNLLLWAQKKKIINSWAIRFNLNCFNNNLMSLQPRYSLVKNCGFGKNATHQKFKRNDKIKTFYKINQKFFRKKLIIKFEEEINEKIKNTHRKSLRLLFHFWLNKFNVFRFF